MSAVIQGISGVLVKNNNNADVNKKLSSLSEYYQNQIKGKLDNISGKLYSVSVFSENSGFSKSDDRRVAVIYYGEPTKLGINDGKILYNADQLIELYINHGRSFIEYIGGAFVVILLDEARHIYVIATDRNGIVPLFYYDDDDALYFSTNLNILVRGRRFPVNINYQAIYDYVYFHVVPGPDTIYVNVKKLLPGNIILSTSKEIKISSYYEYEYEEQPIRDEASHVDDLMKTLKKSVEISTCGRHAGAFLSGGTDSSAIAGLLSQITEGKTRTFSIGFEVDGYDEMEYARIAANHFGTEHHEYYVTPEDVVASIPSIASVHDQPFGNASAIPAYYCARMAKENDIDLLLAGDGGDELFGGNYRYAKQLMFDKYQRLPSLLRKILIEPLFFKVPYPNKFPYINKIRSYIQQANIVMPDRMESYNLLSRIGSDNVFSSDFLVGTDVNRPIKLLTDVYRNSNATCMLNKMLAVDMRFVLTDSDLPKVNKACEMAGISVSYPMLNDSLIDFAARLPASMKVNGTKLRYFYKKSLSGFLPEKIIKKRKQGFGLPFGIWMASHKGLRDLAYDSLENLKKRNIVNNDFIDELMTQKHVEHAAYYGVMIWVLMMLEQWLFSREI